MELGRTKEAKAQFDQVLKNDPESIPGLIGLANILLKEGQTEDVVTLCKRTISVDPRNSQAYALLGEVYIDQRGKGLTLARTPEIKALGWFLMADVYERRHEPDEVTVALRNARMHVSSGRRRSNDQASRD